MGDLFRVLGPDTTVRITLSVDGVETLHETMNWDEYQRRKASHTLPGDPPKEAA
jgi:hypothetical protein